MRDKQYFYALDAARFFAALSVAIFHLGFWTMIPGSTPNHMLRAAPDFRPMANIAWFGWVGVEVFFVISGFVIANSAIGSTPSKFLLSRVLRLYPSVWICATVTLLALLANGIEPFRDLLPRYLHTLALLPNNASWGWIDGVYWTLSVEISFYLLVLLALLTRGVLTMQRLAWLMTLCSCAYLVVIYRSRYGIPPPAYMSIIEVYPNLIGGLLRHGCLFASGIWMWIIANDKMTPFRWCAFAAAVTGGATEVSIRAAEFMSMPVNQGRTMFAPVVLWLIVVFAVFALTRRGSRFTPSTPRAKAVLRNLGLATYPLYLLHDIVGAGVMRILLTIGANNWAALVISIAMIGLLSLTVCTFVEPRIRAALKYMLRALARPVPVPSSD